MFYLNNINRSLLKFNLSIYSLNKLNFIKLIHSSNVVRSNPFHKEPNVHRCRRVHDAREKAGFVD